MGSVVVDFGEAVSKSAMERSLSYHFIGQCLGMILQKILLLKLEDIGSSETMKARECKVELQQC